MSEEAQLPYSDSKPKGAAGFYFAINATFRFIEDRFGHDGLVEYWRNLGESYMRPTWERWKSLGLPGIASYWRAFFAAEPEAEVEILEADDRIVLDVRVCPIIHYLRKNDREIFSRICEHCYYISEAAAQKAGFTVRIEGGAGVCRQTFFKAGTVAPQNLSKIAEVRC